MIYAAPFRCVMGNLDASKPPRSLTKLGHGSKKQACLTPAALITRIIRIVRNLA